MQAREELATMKAEIRQLSELMKVLAAAMSKENNNPNKSANNPQPKAQKGNRTWEGTATHMDFIQWGWDTTARLAKTKGGSQE